MTNTICCEYSTKTPDDGQYVCPKHVELFTEIKLRNSADFGFYCDTVTYMFRANVLSIIRSLTTVFTAIGICHTSYADSLLDRFHPDLASRLSAEPVLQIPVAVNTVLRLLMMESTSVRNM